MRDDEYDGAEDLAASAAGSAAGDGTGSGNAEDDRASANETSSRRAEASDADDLSSAHGTGGPERSDSPAAPAAIDGSGADVAPDHDVAANRADDEGRRSEGADGASSDDAPGKLQGVGSAAAAADRPDRSEGSREDDGGDVGADEPRDADAAAQLPSVPGHDVLRRLGSGGMATVYVARQATLERAVAVKVLARRYAGDDHFYRRFEREARVASRFAHPNIVPLHDFGRTQDGRPWFSMELVEGGSLRDRLTRDGALPPSEAVRCVRSLASALAVIHGARVIHRDLKPENVLLRDGEPCISDFGIAKVLDAETQLTLHGAMGTARYMSPELIEHGQASEQSDLYALGILMHELLAGRPPFIGSNVSALMISILETSPLRLPAAVAGLQPLVSALIARQPADRFESAEALVHALDEVAERLEGGLSNLTLTEGMALPPGAFGAVIESSEERELGLDDLLQTSVRPALTTGQLDQTTVRGDGPGGLGSSADPRQSKRRRLLAPGALAAVAFGIGVALLALSGKDAAPTVEPSIDEITAEVAAEAEVDRLEGTTHDAPPAPDALADGALVDGTAPDRSSVDDRDASGETEAGAIEQGQRARETLRAELVSPPITSAAQDAADRAASFTNAAGALHETDLSETNASLARAGASDAFAAERVHPALLPIAAGAFTFGCADDGCDRDERPARRREVAAFAISVTEVTVDDYRAFVDATGHPSSTRCEGRGQTADVVNEAGAWRTPPFPSSGAHPVVCVSARDGAAYARWLSDARGQRFALPSEAQWEYAARAATRQDVSIPRGERCARIVGAPARCAGERRGPAAADPERSNPWGIADLVGNVWEWTADCATASYASYREGSGGRCSAHVVRGGAWFNGSADLRDGNRYALSADGAFSFVGLRLVRRSQRPENETPPAP